MRNWIRKLQESRGRVIRRVKEETGATAVEYGMLVALIAAVVVGTVAILGPRINDAFQAVVDALTAAGV